MKYKHNLPHPCGEDTTITIGYCESCGTGNLSVQKYPGYLPHDHPRSLCTICASTFIGNHTIGYGAVTVKDLVVVVAQVTNLLLREIRRTKAS